MNDPAREDVIEQFLRANGSSLRTAKPLAQDASFRRYLRLPGAVLMDAPPPEDIGPFLHIAAHLAGIGLTVPRILAADATAGLILEEDLGDTLFSTVLTEATVGPLLDAAVDALIVMHRAAPPIGLPAWGKSAMLETACGALFDWWWPTMFGGLPRRIRAPRFPQGLAPCLPRSNAARGAWCTATSSQAI